MCFEEIAINIHANIHTITIDADAVDLDSMAIWLPWWWVTFDC